MNDRHQISRHFSGQREHFIHILSQLFRDPPNCAFTRRGFLAALDLAQVRGFNSNTSGDLPDRECWIDRLLLEPRPPDEFPER